MGTMMTYGSYLPNDSPIEKNTIAIVAVDTCVAIAAGLAILPAVFSLGLKPSAGPGLLFVTLPEVFAKLRGGAIVSVAFFTLVLLAALTSSISLLEVVVTSLTEEKKLSRKKAVLLSAGGIFVFSVAASLSISHSNLIFLKQNFFDGLSFLTDKIIMPLGGLLVCIITAYIWGLKKADSEIAKAGAAFRGRPLYKAAVSVISPLLILIIFTTSISV
jgi:NSS family neurotransmitter:Na+ symporter